VEIFQRQSEIFRKRAIVRNDAEYRTPGTMRLQAAPAEGAHRPVAIGGAGHIDFACHALPEPALSCFGGDARNLRDFTDKFVSRRAAKIVIPAQDFYISVADAREVYADQSPTAFQPWERFSSGNKLVIVDRKAEHGILLLGFLGQGTPGGGSGHALEHFEFRFHPDQAAVQILAVEGNLLHLLGQSVHAVLD
jgi:hypothetical protein